MPITPKDFENIQVLKSSKVKKKLKMFCAENGLTMTDAIKELLSGYKPKQ